MTTTAPDFEKLAALLLIANDRVTKAQQIKRAFVPPEAAAAAGGAGGVPPPGGMDPAMMGGGGAPPMDPAMMGGGGGGAPPMDPAMMGGGGGMPPSGGDPIEAFRSIVKEELAAAGMGTGGAAGGGAPGQIKPKIDVNVELMQIKKMLARLADTMGVHIPASEMVATPQDLGAMAQGGGMPPAVPPAAPPLPPKTASDDYTGQAYAFETMIRQANATRSSAAALADILDRR